MLEGAQPHEVAVESGVLQGTVLTPLLFIAMINELPKTLKYSCAGSFADDTKIAKAITNIQDCKNLSLDLASIYSFSVENRLPFNSDKFKILRYKAKSSADALDFAYFAPDGKEIVETESIKDLGIIMSSSLNFREHIKFISTKCRLLSGWILRAFSTRERLPMLTLWKSLIIPRDLDWTIVHNCGHLCVLERCRRLKEYKEPLPAT